MYLAFNCIFLLLHLLFGLLAVTVGHEWRNWNYTETVQWMRQLQRNHSDLVQLISIGKSVQNRDLWLLRLSTEDPKPPLSNKEILYRHYLKSRQVLRPSVKLIGTVHGNEPLGKHLLLTLAHHLANARHSDSRIGQLVNTTTIELLPMMNPDGFEVAREGDCAGIRKTQLWNGRENAHNVDLDQNFIAPFSEDDWKTKVEPETLSVMTWLVSNPSFVLSGAIHTGLRVVTYPYDEMSTTTPDDPLFRALATNYVKSHANANDFIKGCSSGDRFPNGIVIGNELRSKNSMTDFNYLKTNCLEIDLFLSCCKYSNITAMTWEWEANRDSLLKLIQSAHMGIKGMVIDADTKSPISGAIVSITDYGHNITTSEQGEYWRLLLPGTYMVTVSSFGYLPSSKNVTVSNLTPFDALKVDFELQSEIEKEQPLDMPEFVNPPTFEHHNYVKMERVLKELNANYSHITRLYSMGQSVEGRELYVLEITDNPGIHEFSEPEFKFVANMHGNEVVGREAVLLFAQMMLENYGKNESITWLVNNTRIHLVPSMNPDGYEKSNLGDCDSLIGRGNANKVDLNRNFPDQFRSYSENRVQEKETNLVMNWLKAYPFVLSANLHGGALVANYPYDGNSKDIDEYNGTPDDALFRHLALTYSKNHPYMHKGHCHKKCSDSKLLNEYFPDGIINGAEWYSLYGGMQDWNYLNTNCFEITVEMSCQKFPPAEELPHLWVDNRRSMLRFLELVHTGIKGVVRDSHTNGSVVDATIKVDLIDHVVHSVPPYGDFWRLLLPGSYRVTASKLGYESQSKMVNVANGTSATWVEFQLHRSKEANDSVFNTNRLAVAFSAMLLVTIAILFTFCMAMVWCPSATYRFTRFFTSRSFFTPNSPTKNESFHYTPLRVDDDIFRDDSDEDILLQK